MAGRGASTAHASSWAVLIFCVVPVPTLQLSIKALIDAMQGLDRAEYSLLQDMRAVRGRNDPEFEQAIKRELPAMTGDFRKLGVLVSTQVGRLQVQRHFPKASTQQARAFLDEQEALRWLSEP